MRNPWRTRRIFARSTLLNRPGFNSIAAVSGDLSVTYRQERDETGRFGEAEELRMDGSVSISDCTRSITLEFEAGTKDAMWNAYEKARRLANFFDALAETIMEEVL